MKRVAAVVEGRVQGVGFRYFAQSIAARHRLSGWVRNTPDGSVELEAQGSAADVDAFIAEMREGPSLSHVAEVRLHDLPLDKTEQGFGIRF
jgi:acylphosphatase